MLTKSKNVIPFFCWDCLSIQILFFTQIMLKHFFNYTITQRDGWIGNPSHQTWQQNWWLESLLWNCLNDNMLKKNLPLGNHCRPVSENKIDNPLNSHGIPSGKHDHIVEKEKRCHDETQYLVCIGKTLLSYSTLSCVSLCWLLIPEKNVCSGRWLEVAKVIFFLFLS